MEKEISRWKTDQRFEPFWIPRGSLADKIPRIKGFPQSRVKVVGPFWTLVGKRELEKKKKKIAKSYLNQWSIERWFDIEQGYLQEFFWKGTQPMYP